MNNRFARASTKTTTTTTTTMLKAQNPENQAGLDKLYAVYERASSNPNSNYVHTVRRAMTSLQKCPTAITTQKEACELKFVGPSIAKIICPTYLPSPTSISTSNNATTRKRSRATTTTAASVEQGPTKKEKVYQQEKLAAESLDLSNCGPWKVILIIDGREHKSQHVVSKCKQSGIPCEERHLPIGDMAWIAQAQDKISGRTIEVLCGTIVERKEVGDLANSLFGTRYNEQRMRLKSSGLPQLLFLVEGHLGANVNCPKETLEMAIMETRCLGFQVIQTENLMDTVKRLKGLHRRVLQRTFPEAFTELPTYTRSPTGSFGLHRKRRPSSLLEMTFDTSPKPALGAKRFITYTELKAKVELDRETGTRTVGAIYMAMLKQIPTLSDKKCVALAKMYPTMNALMTAYATSEDPAKMIQDVPLGQQKMGPKSSEAVYTACCTQRDGSRPSGPTMDFDDIPVAPVVVASVATGPLDSYFAPSPKATASAASTSSAIVAVATKTKPYSPPSPERKMAAVECVDLTEDTPPRPNKKASYLDPAPAGSTVNPTAPAALYSSKATPKTSVHLDYSSPLFSSPDDSLLYAEPPFAKRSKASTSDTALSKSFDSTPSPPTVASKKDSPEASKKPVAAKPDNSPSILVIDSSDDDDDDDLLQKPSAVAARAAAAAASYNIPAASSTTTIRRVSDGSSNSSTSTATSGSKKEPPPASSTTANVTMRKITTNATRWQDCLGIDSDSDDDDLGVSLDLRTRLAKRANQEPETIVID